MTNFRGPVNSRNGFKLGGLALKNIVFAGEHTTAGGAAAEAITVNGVLADDVVLVTLSAVGNTPRTILTSAATANTITVTFSGDPSTDHVVSYVVIR